MGPRGQSGWLSQFVVDSRHTQASGQGRAGQGRAGQGGAHLSGGVKTNYQGPLDGAHIVPGGV